MAEKAGEEKVAPKKLSINCNNNALYSYRMYCKAESLVRMGLRTGLSDGWGGSMIGTELTDILFGTLLPTQTVTLEF